MFIEPKVIVEILKRRRKLLFQSVMITTSLAVVYSVVTPKIWTATQALYVRDEGSTTGDRLGQFQSVDAMQTAQETILQLTRQHTVLENSLRSVGPDRGSASKPNGTYPDLETVDRFRKMVSVDAPKGAQFGRTEMIYLTVKARSTERAMQLTEAVTTNLIERSKALRKDKYEGIAAELEKSVTESRLTLAAANEKLREIERQVGPDLAELRSINDAAFGDGHLQNAASEIERDLRTAETELSVKRLQLAQLQAIQGDSRQLIAMPAKFLDDLPMLKKLKEGFVDAQLNVSKTLSELSPDHPRSISAVDEENRVRNQLAAELRNTIKSLASDIELAEKKLQYGAQQRDTAQGRMRSIADLRVQYENAVADVKQRLAILEKAESDLASAKAKVVSSSTSLIQRVDQPIPSAKAIGPGRMTLWGVGAFGGLLIGLGIVFLIEPSFASTGRRAADQWARGRRASDLISVPQFGRRTTDHLQITSSSIPPSDRHARPSV
jgi:polysaccharide biosynthesis transport protein